MKEAIKELTKLRNFATKGTVTYKALDIAIKVLEAQKWIPVSKNPKTSGYYNCTCYDGVAHRVTTLKWSNGWVLSGRRAYWKVLAWTPLPEPYMEDEE